jgi:hypothetical protein
VPAARKRLAATLVAIALAVFSGSADASRAAAAHRFLPDCAGIPRERPHRVTLTCADGNFGVRGLFWIVWGGRLAVGLGQAWANDCTPSCAGGHFHYFRAVLILSRSLRCPTGKLFYRTIAYAFVGRSPFRPDARGTVKPFRTVTCTG